MQILSLAVDMLSSLYMPYSAIFRTLKMDVAAVPKMKLPIYNQIPPP
jgi:hypothetical protein